MKTTAIQLTFFFSELNGRDEIVSSSPRARIKSMRPPASFRRGVRRKRKVNPNGPKSGRSAS